MSKLKQWLVCINGINYQVDFFANQWTGKHKLHINGQDVELKKSPFQVFVGLDQTITIGGKECRFVLIGNKPDIAIDGTYVDSGKPYIPLKNMPWWNLIFIVACIAIPIVSLGGALPVVIAILGAIYCVRISISPNMKTPLKILSCTGITAITWASFGLLLLAMSNL